MEVQARKFYSQRNMYLCGFTLFLSLILNRTYVMILETLRLEQKLKSYEGTDKNTKESEKLAQAGESGEIAGYKRELSKKDKEKETALSPQRYCNLLLATSSTQLDIEVPKKLRLMLRNEPARYDHGPIGS